MPWAPELFTAPALEQLLEKRRREELATVPYFDGLMAGEPDALVESFDGEPLLYDPVRGRVKGVRAFRAFISEMNEWLRQHHVVVDEVEHVVLGGHGFGEVVLHLDGPAGRTELPVAIVADRSSGGLIDELRIYSSSWPLFGRHANRPPLLQRDPELVLPAVVADYQRALAAGNVEAIAATFEPDGYAREPAGGEHVHRGPEARRAFYEQLFSDGGIHVEHCALLDDGRVSVLEYNMVRWGGTPLPPQAGAAVFVRGESGRVAAVRIFDDVEPPR